jgi:geranylgeranyl diphosphate synthase type II
MSWAEWSAPRLALLEGWVERSFSDVWPDAFVDMLRYPLITGGKRVRPALVFAAAEAVNPSIAPARVLPVAAAFELVHTYSLVHDDLPAMDDDDVRRGRPTAHRVYGEAAAILVGDGLLTEAFAVVAGADAPADVRIAIVARLAAAAGVRGMVGGQAADVGLGGKVAEIGALERLHRGKTGALLCGSAVCGGLLAGASPSQLAALERYGWAVGLAFQLADDVLDADQDEGDDGPPSYVRLLGIDETRRRARALAEEAIAAAGELPSPGILTALARYIVDRDV